MAKMASCRLSHCTLLLLLQLSDEQSAHAAMSSSVVDIDDLVDLLIRRRDNITTATVNVT